MNENSFKTAANMERLTSSRSEEFVFVFLFIQNKMANTNKDYVKPVRGIIFNTQLILMISQSSCLHFSLISYIVSLSFSLHCDATAHLISDEWIAENESNTNKQRNETRLKRFDSGVWAIEHSWNLMRRITRTHRITLYAKEKRINEKLRTSTEIRQTMIQMSYNCRRYLCQFSVGVACAATIKRMATRGHWKFFMAVALAVLRHNSL